ncbi:hypothetical protein ABZP36_003979 [Zizania latifolia]
MELHKLAVLVLWLGVAISTARFPAAAGAPPLPSSGCQRMCGNVEIPYPFGIWKSGESPADHCAHRGFYLTCNDTGHNVYRPFSGNVEVREISLQRGQARMLNHISSACYNTATRAMNYNDWWLNFTGTPFVLSDNGNKFTVLGCQTLAYISDNGNAGKYMSGCVAMCRQRSVTNLVNGSCSGMGCCQTAIPTGLQYYRVRFDKGFNTSAIYNFSRCSYAVLMESSSFSFRTSYVTSPEFNSTDGGQVPLVMDWAIRNETCEKARMNAETYACVSNNSECFNSLNGPGYICNCSKGYTGNPYLQDLQGGCTGVSGVFVIALAGFLEAMVDGMLLELLDSDIVNEASMGVIHQAAVLASQCLAVPGSTRPTMKRVAEELQRLAQADELQQYPQPPLVIESRSFMEIGSTCTTSSWYAGSNTTGVYSLENKVMQSTEFAR